MAVWRRWLPREKGPTLNERVAEYKKKLAEYKEFPPENIEQEYLRLKIAFNAASDEREVTAIGKLMALLRKTLEKENSLRQRQLEKEEEDKNAKEPTSPLGILGQLESSGQDVP